MMSCTHARIDKLHHGLDTYFMVTVEILIDTHSFWCNFFGLNTCVLLLYSTTVKTRITEFDSCLTNSNFHWN